MHMSSTAFALKNQKKGSMFMNEVKRPRKPLLFYYGIAFLVVILLNIMFIPWLMERQIKEVDYGTFMTMIEEQDVGLVEISETENHITFTDGDKTQIYRTARMDDPTLTERLYNSGAEFSGEIMEEPNWLVQFLLTWILPAAIFIALGQFLSKNRCIQPSLRMAEWVDC